MQTVKVYRNGWSVHMEKGNALYSVILRDWSGEVHDKVQCDDYRDALAYRRSFMTIAKQAAV